MATRTLLITRNNGEEIQIDIPEDWKVTFGPAAAGISMTDRSGKNMPMALRIYETEKLQRAIFLDVVSFRDMSIPIRIKRVDTQEKDGFMECEGIRKRTIFQASTVNWINPDAEVPEENLPKLSMPKDSEIFGETEAP